ncbi:MAG: grasp-with-spasm system ATP-grasp peptide maturase [Bacteroidetes bacterium]|nr:MAG: grasp-with-spasm system ATP-grasp peptide maturase [Bacteroidota bacterium]TAG87282.1 MAG: grasp-with-spasm system ATP-grasp peptide maturase [Bacteroidota bacterium]
MNILILSEEQDMSTCHVYDWLYVLSDKKIIRVNLEDDVRIAAYTFNNYELIINAHINLNSNNIHSFWYRRGAFISKNKNYIYDENLNDIITNVQKNIDRENNSIFYNIYAKLVKNNKSVGDFFTADVNKIHILELATKCNLNVPNTIITTKKEELVLFFNSNSDLRIVTKPIASKLQIRNRHFGVYFYTEIVERADIDKLSDTFEISLFQTEIKKKYELRIFYLKGEFYTMAIFSQLDQQTKIDFRKYNDQNPNRNVPFNLPNDIKNKLKNLMNDCKLDTGSIDMVVDENNDYYFLEVNPVGQFGMVSYPCNYNLEKKIAEKLI